MTGVPLLSLEGALSLNPTVDPFQNEALVEMWMEFKIKPLLNSITKHFLSCLSTKNFSCSTYQTVYVWVSVHLPVSVTFVTATSHHPLSSCSVRELSHHFSEMNPVRQKWIYTFFMYPFLSGDSVAGKAFMCLNWLNNELEITSTYFHSDGPVFPLHQAAISVLSRFFTINKNYKKLVWHIKK